MVSQDLLNIWLVNRGGQSRFTEYIWLVNRGGQSDLLNIWLVNRGGQSRFTEYMVSKYRWSVKTYWIYG